MDYPVFPVSPAPAEIEKNLVVVQISDFRWSKRQKDVIVTYSLGSCVGLIAYDPLNQIGGMIHCLLPAAPKDSEKARDNPFMFVNTGVAAMMRRLLKAGAARSNLVLKAAGGAKMMGVNNMFDTGARNVEALNKMLAVNDLRLAACDFGGGIPRTLSLDVETGRVVVKSFGRETYL